MTSKTSSVFDAIGGKFIVILLIVGIMATAGSNMFTAINNQNIVDTQNEFLHNLVNGTRLQVEEHNNQTEQTLELFSAEVSRVQQREQNITAPIIEEFHQLVKTNNQTLEFLQNATDRRDAELKPIFETFAGHINSTEQNNDILRELLLDEMKKSNNTTGAITTTTATNNQTDNSTGISVSN